jgi:phosphate:Na+ symporter
VADLAVDLAHVAESEVPPSEVLDEKVLENLSDLFKRAHRTYVVALQAVRDGDLDLAQIAGRQDDKMDRLYCKARMTLAKRRKAGKIEPAQDARYFELLRNLERISDHADNLGVSMLRAWPPLK